MTTKDAPVLRTLSPALRGLELKLRSWLASPRKYPVSVEGRAALESLCSDLKRQADALEVERPLLVVMLMGGTGVGKSTLLNALAGGSIAQASFQRPTTRDPVVYYHESVKPDRLDPALRHCRMMPHDRPALEQKILVDTPDLDSTDLANRERTVRLLPVADVILYVGSQEKYHDQLVWNEFLAQRKRRAFAFVVNKWDRCVHSAGAGLRPDEDLLRDLESLGFDSPLLFRTCAQTWVDKANNTPAAELPEGETFHDLVNWLEMGLSRLEIEAIKTRGVGQMLASLGDALRAAAPPDLGALAAKVKGAWARPLAEEAASTSDVLVNSLQPYQREIEHHFALEGQRRFRGLMGWYLRTVAGARFAGSSLRSRIPFVSRSAKEAEEAPAAWDLARFTAAAIDVAGGRELDARGKALVNTLLVAADAEGFPLPLLTDPVETASKADWRRRYSQGLIDELAEVEKQWTRPTGTRRVIQSALVVASDWLPPVALFATIANLLWRFFNVSGSDALRVTDIGLIHVLLPFIVLLAVLVLLHVLIYVLLPLRWDDIRAVFHKRLEARVRHDLEAAYLPVPSDLAANLEEERRRVKELGDASAEVLSWLESREQAASVAGLYGK